LPTRDRARRGAYLKFDWLVAGYQQARRARVTVLDRDYLDLTKTINRGILAFLSTFRDDRKSPRLRAFASAASPS
jgi:hypothetical protein